MILSCVVRDVVYRLIGKEEFTLTQPNVINKTDKQILFSSPKGESYKNKLLKAELIY